MKSIAIAAILMAVAVTAARAEDVMFSFSGGISSPGTVTGELFGLSPNGTSSPTDVILLSNPDGVQNGDLSAMGWFNYYASQNSFTTVNGVITAENFSLFSANTDDILLLGLPFDNASFNLLYDALTDLQTGNASGVDGVVFTAVDVPEPASFFTLLVGCVMAGCAGRRSFLKKRTKRLLCFQAFSAGWVALGQPISIVESDALLKRTHPTC